MAWAAPLAFATLAATLVAVGAVRSPDAIAATAAALLAYLPSGWVAPGGWSRRAAEAALLPAGYALTMLGDPTLLRMALPPLLVVAAAAAAAAAVSRAHPSHHPMLAVALALAVRCAGGPGLLGEAPASVLVAVVAPAALAWGAARWSGAAAGGVAALLAGAAPLQHRPWAAAAIVVAGLALARRPRFAAGERVAQGWLPGAAAAAMALTTVSGWGGLPLDRAFPAAGWAALAAVAVALLTTPLLPRAAAAAAWLGVVLALGPLQPPPPDVAGFSLAPDAAVQLPASTGGPYLLELTLANAGQVPQETVVAEVQLGDLVVGLRAGLDAVEWAHERDDVRPLAAHSLPVRPVWRPVGLGRNVLWAVAGRTLADVPAGVRPVLRRAAGLAPAVGVAALAAGPARPTPPRDWSLGDWLLAAAVAVAALQVAAGTWRSMTAWAPWTLLAAAAVAGRVPVEPLRLLLERHAVDVALAAVVAAWVPASLVWLARRRVVLAVAALLVPLALATPHLMPSGGDEPYHLILLRSLAEDGDLALDDNYDVDRYPGNTIYVTPALMHSPALAALLLPGYLVAGRTGALVLLAVAGAALAALVWRRALDLGVAPSRASLLVLLLCLSYPLATYSTQIWTEVPGALAAALGLVVVAAWRSGPLAAAGLGLAATAIKTRLALVTFPIAFAGLARLRTDRRRLGVAALTVCGLAAAGLAAGVVIYGHPLGPFRRFVHLVPSSLSLAVTVLGGLLFDAAGGLAFAAPLGLLACAALPRLWRTGGVGEKGLLVGLGTTVAALLASIEWYGGGSPPLRYLVPALPAFALAAATLLKAPVRLRRLAPLLLPFSVFVWWTLVARPQFGFNPGDGGWWLSGALARRFAAGAQHLFPSFLAPRQATVVVPLVLAGLAIAAAVAAHRRPAVLRRTARLAATVWLLLGAATVVAVTQRHDTFVEIEEPQVERRGGEPVPPTGTYSRFLHRNGWRLGDGDAVVVPLHLPAGAGVTLSGWSDVVAGADAALLVSWNAAAPARLPLPGGQSGVLALPRPPGPGRHRLHLGLAAAGETSVVLDRLEVRP